MSAIDRVIDFGEYRVPGASKKFFDAHLVDPLGETAPAKRLLFKILIRALFDFCMYRERDPRHISAKNWVLNFDSDEFPINLSDLLKFLGLHHIRDDIVQMVTSGGVHKEKIMQMRRVLYRYDE